MAPSACAEMNQFLVEIAAFGDNFDVAGVTGGG
jgi:hypothetical protein